jgi:DNA-binding response OmpR family regulator
MGRENFSTGHGVDLDEISVLERQKILIIDDDPESVRLLKTILLPAGFNVLSACDGKDALKKVADHQPHLILLDILMEQMDGWELLRYLREMSRVPMIIISEYSDKSGIVKALMNGVDDYITKPYYNPEVVARVIAVLRRFGESTEISRRIFPKVGLMIDMHAQEVIQNGKRIQLTQKEFELLVVLAKYAPNVVNYQEITEAVWGEDTKDARKRAKYLIYLLRRKLGSGSSEGDLIENVDRLGYKLQTEG